MSSQLHVPASIYFPLYKRAGGVGLDATVRDRNPSQQSSHHRNRATSAPCGLSLLYSGAENSLARTD